MSEKALIKIEQYDLITLFTQGGSAEMLEKIKRLALEDLPGIKTSKERKVRISRAVMISASKTLVDTARIAQVEKEKKRLKLIDVEGKHIRDCLDFLKAEVRGPVTEWENKQKAIKGSKIIVKEIGLAIGLAIEHEKIADQQRAIDKENARIADNKRIEKEVKKREDANQKKKDDEKLAILQREANAKAELEREKEKRETDRLNAEREKEEAEKQSKIHTENALKMAEQQRILREKADLLEIEKKAANQAHRKRINNEALQSFTNQDFAEQLAELIIKRTHEGDINRQLLQPFLDKDFTEKVGKLIIGRIYRGEIKNISINY